MRSSQYFAIMPAWCAVPQAIVVILPISPSANGRSGRWMLRVAGLISACNVSPITAGCSKISFCMKWR